MMMRTKQSVFGGAYKKRFSHGLSILLMLALCGSLAACQKQEKEDRKDLEEAQRLISEGSFAAAFVRLNHALTESPRDPDVHLNLGWLYLYTDDNARALKEWRKAEELAPDRPDVYHLHASIFSDQAIELQKKDRKQAERLQVAAVNNYKKALELVEDAQERKQELNPSFKLHQVYFDLATALLALNRNREALDALDKGFEYIPKDDLETQVNFQITSCSTHARLKLYEEAIEDCRQAQEFTPTSAGKQRIEDMIQNMRLLNPNSPAPAGSFLPSDLKMLEQSDKESEKTSGEAMD